MSPGATSDASGLQVLLIEPYHAGSHAHWAQGYAAASRHDVRVLALPGRFWRWRLRGGAITVADMVADVVERTGPPDAIVASSMVDLAQLLGLTRRLVGDVPVVLYMHENQLAFPRRDATDVDAAFRTWGSLLAADRVVFNSHHHRRAVLEGLERLRAHMPDQPHDLDPRRIADVAAVVPVGVEVEALLAGHTQRDDGVPVVLWPHRWDDDKQPDVFVRASEQLIAEGVEHEIVLAGADEWDGATRRRAAADRLGARVRSAEFVDRDAYLALLPSCDVVVSVADHEFFGVAVVEAIAAGCVPVLPDRLSYPEIIDPAHHAAALYPEGGFRRRLGAVLRDLDAARARIEGLAESMRRYDWSVVAPMLDAEVRDVAGHEG